MNIEPVTLPLPLSSLVAHSLDLCKLMLPIKSRFYPFAATFLMGKVECVFCEDSHANKGNSELIESLHRHLSNLTKVADNYSVLVFPTSIKGHRKDIEVIAINTRSPESKVSTLLYPYFRLEDKVVVSPPLSSPYA